MESVMKASFVYNINTTRVVVRQPKVLDLPYHHLPRSLRKTLRITTPKAVCNTHQGVDHYLRTELRTDDYHNQNLEFLARDYGYDEFNDIDNEFEGLTVFEPENEVELYEFCTGYDVL
jgi:hypothetical protein